MNSTQILSLTLSILFISILPGSLTAQSHYYQTPPPSFSKTTLQARVYAGGDLEGSFPWVRDVSISSEAKVYFRWGTREEGVTSAQWQVTDSPDGFTQPFTIIASGMRTQIPTLGQLLEFAIDFKAFLPPTPPAQPKKYYVRIVPSKGRVKFGPSLIVKVTHVQPGPQPVIDDFSFNRFE